MLLSLAVSVHGYMVNEYIEKLIWEAMLRSEMTYVEQRIAEDSEYDISDLDLFRWYDQRDDIPVPDELLALPPGITDEVKIGEKQYVVLVEEGEQGRNVLTLEITELEGREFARAVVLVISAIFVIVILALLSVFGVNRLMGPLVRMADEILRLRPEGEGSKLVVNPKDAYETFIIATSINGFSDRIREYIERERNFINMASHELRTPIAVMKGATEVLVGHPDVTPGLRPHLARSKRIVDQMEDLVAILLVLARAPDRLASNSQELDLREELPSIVSDHEYLCADKDLQVQVDLREPIRVLAPLNIVRVAIGNLLRNAIENSNKGVIRIHSDEAGSISIDDPGQGMTPQEMSRLYTRAAKSGEAGAGGIGIELIMRICNHLGWKLHFESSVGIGTKAVLTFSH